MDKWKRRKKGGTNKIKKESGRKREGKQEMEGR